MKNFSSKSKSTLTNFSTTPKKVATKSSAHFIKNITAVLALIIMFCNTTLTAQNIFPATGAVGIGTTTPNASALLDVTSTSKGLLIPRMTIAQRDAIVKPATGLLVFVTDRSLGFYYFNGSAWVSVAGANTSLSNLTATSINQTLNPSVNKTFDVGSAAKRWSRIYADTGNFSGDVDIHGNILQDGLRVISINSDNTALGIGSFNTSTGFYNTGLGCAALGSNVNGIQNTAVGRSVLSLNKSGSSNTGTGSLALQNNDVGSSNTATGASAMLSNKNGYENTANGALALASNTSGNNNVAVGSNALFNSNSSYIVAVGDYALEQSTTGLQNVAVGSKAGNQTKGSNNSYLGFQAGFFDNSSNITAIGNQAGWSVANGYGCTFVGSQDGPTVAGLYNVTGIGYNVTPTASNQVRIGNSLVTSIGGAVKWSVVSDGRFKRNIKENVPGLAFINLLRPVTYNLDVTALRKFKGEDIKEGNAKTGANISDQEKAITTGFIAQEVETISKKMNYEFDGVDAPKNDKDAYGIRYEAFVVPLVKAVQELSKLNDDKDSKINHLETRIEKLEQLLSSQKSNAAVNQTSVNNISNKAALLEQNVPNPSNNSTVIRYTLPQQYSKAQIIISDNNGRTIQTILLTGSGKNSIQVNVATFVAGTYHYSLIIDNAVIATKQMLIAK